MTTQPPDHSVEDRAKSDAAIAGEIAALWCNCFTGKPEPGVAVETIELIGRIRRAEREEIKELKSLLAMKNDTANTFMNQVKKEQAKLTAATAALELCERALTFMSKFATSELSDKALAAIKEVKDKS